MTDKQIIIDGVDVSGCSYYQYNMCTATKDDYGDCSLCCQDYDMNDCYYKQLKRKEQECEELKHEVELMMDCASCKVDEYKQTLAEIKDYCNKYPQNSIGFKKYILQKISGCEVEK